MKLRIGFSIIVVAVCAAFVSAGGATPLASQSCIGPAGFLVVDLAGDNGRLFVDGSTITLEDLATHELLACSHTSRPATPENTTKIAVQGSGSIYFDGVGGMFGAKDIDAHNNGGVTVIGTPGHDDINADCPWHCEGNTHPFVIIDGAKIAISPPASKGDVFGAGGDDYIQMDGNYGTASHGGDGNDVLNGGASQHAAAVMYGDAGDDDLKGGRGNDFLYGGPGNDSLEGSGNEDWLFGEEGDDNLSAGANQDQLDGGPGSDMMFGDAGPDILYAQDGFADSLDGGDGKDDAYIDPGLDTTTRVEHIH